jgi:ribosomal protein S12 methylthiotransferase
LLAQTGTQEVNLIAQDLTAYGLDLKDGTTLEKLLRELIQIEGIRWIRLLYNYPMFFTDSLIDLIRVSDKICNYLDIPLQHIDSKLLSTMKRKVDEGEVRGLIQKLRSSIPGLTLRTTLIVGFPGETDAQFKKLVEFVKETEFDRLGVFTYSQEEGTVAAKMENQISQKVKKQRQDQIMGLQQKISLRRNKALVGKQMKILIDRKANTKGGYSYVGRTEGQALDIDGNVFLKGENLQVGSFVKAQIEKSSEYDLFASVH